MFAALFLSACAAEGVKQVPDSQKSPEKTTSLETGTNEQAVEKSAEPVTDEEVGETDGNSAVMIEEEEVVPSQENGGKVPNENAEDKDDFEEAILSGDSNNCYELNSSSLQRDCLMKFGVEIKYGEGDASTQAPVLPEARAQ